MTFKIKYRQTCCRCGVPMEKGTTAEQSDAGVFHAKGCQPARYEPRGTVRRPGDGGRRPTNMPGTLYGPKSGPSV